MQRCNVTIGTQLVIDSKTLKQQKSQQMIAEAHEMKLLDQKKDNSTLSIEKQKEIDIEKSEQYKKVFGGDDDDDIDDKKKLENQSQINNTKKSIQKKKNYDSDEEAAISGSFVDPNSAISKEMASILGK